MLRSPCRSFRKAYEPGRWYEHRSECRACDDYATLVDHLATCGLHKVIPRPLVERLRRLSQRGFTCRDADRLWIPLLDGELEPAAASRWRQHRESCQRCAAVYSSLLSVSSLPPAPLPEGLRRRMSSLAPGQPASAPLGIRQARYAAAASYLLVVAVALTLGNPYTVSRDLAVQANQRTAGVLLRAERIGHNALSSAFEAAKLRLVEQKSSLEELQRSLRDRLERLKEELPGRETETAPHHIPKES